MEQEFDATRNVYLDRDQQGTVRQLRHVDAPFVSQGRTPQLAAAEYLHNFGDLLQLTAAELGHLGLPPATQPQDAGVEFRYLGEKQQFDMATVAYNQTALGLPVFEAGVAVQMKTAPFRVLSSQSTQHPDIHVDRPTADAVKRAESLQAAQLARALGLNSRDTGPERPDRKSLVIERRQLIVYRYEADKVQRDGPPAIITAQHDENGRHYVSVRVDFVLPLPTWGPLHWTAILDLASLTVLYLRPHVDDVTGLVFDVDPVTTNGGPLPSANSAALNPVRVSETLLGLIAPAAGTQSLTGDTVALVDSEAPTVAPPTEPAGTNFDF